jgi:hypothetical protein
MNILEKIKKGLSKFWNETLGADYTTEELAGLNIDSQNPTERILAESEKSIDARVQDYGSSSKAQRRKILEEVGVKEEQLDKTPKAKSPKSKTSKQQGREIVD